MAILTKIRSATLVEVLIATVLIVVVFVMASLVLNNLLLNTFSKNTHNVEYRMNELEYQLQSKMLLLPYAESYENWEITMEKKTDRNNEIVVILAKSTGSKKQVERKRSYEE